MGKRKRYKSLKTGELRILVCGSRNWISKNAIERELKKRFEYRDKGEKAVTVIHGCARGADSLAGAIAKEANIPVEEYPANWERDGLAAGYRRNQRMLDKGRPTLVLAFIRNLDQSKGTKDMVERAEANGILVKVFNE